MPGQARHDSVSKCVNSNRVDDAKTTWVFEKVCGAPFPAARPLNKTFLMKLACTGCKLQVNLFYDWFSFYTL